MTNWPAELRSRAVRSPRTRPHLDRVRRRTAAFRPLPDFVVLGAQKAGTTFLFHRLCRQRAVSPPISKEIHHFDEGRADGVAAYRSAFPTMLSRRVMSGSDAITGECTPSYLYFDWVAAEMAEVVPRAQLVAVIRDPVARAYSHYWHSRARGEETLSFEDACRAEGDRLSSDPRSGPDALRSHRSWSYQDRGKYVTQIRRYHEHFGTDRLLVVTSDALRRTPDEVMERVCAHVGTPFVRRCEETRRHQRSYPPMDPRTRGRLEEMFDPWNDELERHLGVSLPW